MSRFKGTRVICYTDKDRLYFDCENHAGDREACLQISAVCNVLLCHCIDVGIKPIHYQAGHVHLEVQSPSDPTKAVFAAGMQFLNVLASQYPDHIKVY